jgi:hypothetical protein
MCYEQRLFRSWATKKAQKREENKPVTERAPPQVVPIRPAPTPETTRRKEVERSLEEIV